MLEKKLITAALLIDSKIGKRLSAVEEKTETESEKEKEIKELKEKLKKRWTDVYKRSKQKA